MKNEKKEFIDKDVVKYFSIVSIIIVFIIIAYALFVDCFSIDRGTFGDMFGGLNALFSGLAFAGIIITILVQMKELRLQRKVQEETQQELKNQKEEFQIQNKTLRIQRFENTFFQMLDLHHDIVSGMKLEKYEGRAVFKGHFFRLKEALIDKFKYLSDFNSSTPKTKEELDNLLEKENLKNVNDLINNRYDDVYKYVGTTFGHYYKNLYRIFKYIDSVEFVSVSEIAENDWYKKHFDFYDIEKVYFLINNVKKYQYTSIVRAQLSDYELQWLFFNCLSHYGIKFKYYVEKYTLLKNYSDIALQQGFIDLGLYKKSAFYKLEKEEIINFTEDTADKRLSFSKEKIFNFTIFDDLIKRNPMNSAEKTEKERDIIRFGKIINYFINK